MGGLDVIASAAKQSISPCKGRMDCFASLAMTPGLWNRGACHRARIRAARWLAMTDARREHSTRSPHNSRALLNANDDTRLVFSSKINVRVIGGSARWLQFSRSQSRQLTPIGVPSVFSRSIPVA